MSIFMNNVIEKCTDCIHLCILLKYVCDDYIKTYYFKLIDVDIININVVPNI